jgi:hypothetical protein
MEQASSAFGRIGALAAFAAKWIIWFTRKYPLAGAAYLVFYVWFFFLRADVPVPPPAPLPQSPAYPPPEAPVLPPAVQPVAQAQAYRDGNQVIIRWSSAVQEQRLSINGQTLTANCQPQSCTAPLPPNAEQVQATWKEANQSFNKTFRF